MFEYLFLCLQGFALEERLLELRCSRYFYVASLDTFLPVPDTPKDFNKQLKVSAAALAATDDPRYGGGIMCIHKMTWGNAGIGLGGLCCLRLMVRCVHACQIAYYVAYMRPLSRCIVLCCHALQHEAGRVHRNHDAWQLLGTEPAPACAAMLFSCRALEDHEWQLTERQLRYGTNDMAIPVQGILALVADEMWHPFYVFQYFSVIIWMAGDAYYTYAVCIFLITWFSIITSAIETHRNMKRLAELAHYTCTVSMLGAPTPQGVADGDLFAQ